MAPAATSRRAHYATFYGLAPLPQDRPLGIVHGNCQAESLRIVLSGAGADVAWVRIPPVHELADDDLPALGALLAQAAIVVSQPIRAGFGGLPVGTSEVLAQTMARAVIVPVIRFAGLYPAHAIVRTPATPSIDPPLVPYHDLRVLAHAAGLRRPRGHSSAAAVRAVRAIARHSVDQLRRREAAHGAVVISDIFADPRFEQMRTINHPGNIVWEILGRRVHTALGFAGDVRDPGRPLLDGIHAPREAAVIEGLELDVEPRPDWIVGGSSVDVDTVREAHLQFYAEHPATVAAGLERHRETIGLLGLR